MLAVDGRLIDLEVAGVDDEPDRRPDGQRDAVRHAVRHANELHLEWADRDAIAGPDGVAWVGPGRVPCSFGSTSASVKGVP